MDSRLFAALRSVVNATAFLVFWDWIALAARVLDPALGGRLPGWTGPVGLLLMSIGLAIALASAGTFVVLYEEPRLQRTFGEPYRRYLREVRRWIPRRPEGR